MRTLRSMPDDLRWTIGFAWLAWFVSQLPLGGWLQFLALLPLVLFLPGYAICSALFPTRELPPEETAVYAVAFSIGAVAIGGVLVQLVLPLNETTWPLLLVVTTAIAVAIATRRHQAGAGQAAPRQTPRQPIGAAATLLLLAALGIAALSIELATDGAHDQAAQARFSSLWIVPDEDGGAGATVGVENEEGQATSYQVVAWIGTAEAGRWTVRLDDEDAWRFQLPASAVSEQKPTVVELWRDGRLYRRAYLRPGAAL